MYYRFYLVPVYVEMDDLVGIILWLDIFIILYFVCANIFDEVAYPCCQ